MNNEKEVLSVEKESAEEKNPESSLASNLEALDKNNKDERIALESVRTELGGIESNKYSSIENKNRGILNKLTETYRHNKLLQATVVGLNMSMIAPEIAVAKNLAEVVGLTKEFTKDSNNSNAITESFLKQLKIGKIDRSLLDAQRDRNTKSKENLESKNNIDEQETNEREIDRQKMCEIIDSVLKNKKYQERLLANFSGDKSGARDFMKRIKERNDQIAGPKGEDWYTEDIARNENGEEQDGEKTFSEKINLGKEYQSQQIRKELLGHISSEDYLKKLAIEFNGDIKEAKEEQEKRKKLVENTKVNVETERTSEEIYEAIRRQAKKRIPENMEDKEKQKTIDDIVEYYRRYFAQKKIGGFHITDNGEKIYIFKDVSDGEQFSNSIKHEFLHSSTSENKNISEKAKKILNETFHPSNRKGERVMNDYLLNNSERLVRKQQLDAQLEEYGVKEYGEKFTRKHYNIMMELYQMRAFSHDVEQFIRTTKPDYKKFEKIFNEIAENNDEKNKQMGGYEKSIA